MTEYPKQILNITQQVETLKSAGMIIESDKEILDALDIIGYYRLRGYSFNLYDNSTKKYLDGTSFHDVLKIYAFDKRMAHLLFSFISEIEVALRSRLIDSMLIYNDALILYDSSIFENKQMFWTNLSSLSSEIARSNDIFIKHNFDNHDGKIPIWAAVEVMSFGTLSKIIRNMKTGKGSAYELLSGHYQFKSAKGKLVRPSIKIFSTWTHTLVILRNMCAHHARLYNRSIHTKPELINSDRLTHRFTHSGLYQLILAMKYLRPSDILWKRFSSELAGLIDEYLPFINLSAMNFPEDWADHLRTG